MYEKKLMWDREFQDWWSQVGWPQGMSFSLDDMDFDEIADLREASGDIIEAPLLPLRDVVMFPRMVTPLFIGRDRYRITPSSEDRGHCRIEAFRFEVR